MDKVFKKIAPAQISDNPFRAIGSDTMLITAGTPEKFNMMTASWGALGVLWHKNVCFCFVRPQRYTYAFMERAEFFTLSFFSRRYKKALDICGSKSGRDINKAEVTGLTPWPVAKGAVAFQEARQVILSRKMYFQDVNPAHFLDAGIQELYPKKDYHRMYVGEIISVFKK